MKDVFISYKSEEFSEARWVKSTLENNGISCWMAPDDIPGGSSYAAEILQAIRSASIFVLVLSEKAQTSPHVAKELDIAINANMVVLPFMLENCDLKDDFYYYLSNVQRYPAYENKQLAIERMIREIKGVIKSGEAQQETAPKKQDIIIEDRRQFSKPSSGNSQNQTAAADADANTANPASDAKTVKKEKPKKEKKQKNEKSAKTKQKGTTDKKKIKKIPAVIGAVLLAIVVFVVTFHALTTVRICGKKYNTNTNYSVYAEDVNVTAADVSNMLKMKKLNVISFTDCTYDADAKNLLMQHLNRYDNITLINCGITDSDIALIPTENVLISNLNISDNDVTSLSPLADSLGMISALNIDHNRITDLSPLADAADLRELHAAGNGIGDDLSVLENAKNLTYLDVSDNDLYSLHGLEYALELDTLYAKRNRISSLDGISNSTLLSSVDVSTNYLHSDALSILEKSAGSLRRLDISDNYIETLTTIQACTNLTELAADKNQLTSLDGISGMTELKGLTAAANKITDITPIAGCKALKEVNLSDNEIADITALPFKNSDNGKYTLYLAGNAITSLTGLPDVAYDKLVVYSNPITQFSFLGDYTFDALYIDYDDNTAYYKFKNDDKYFTLYLFNTPLDQQKKLEEDVGTYHIAFVTDDDLGEIL